MLDRRDSLSEIDALRGVLDAIPHPVFVKNGEGRFIVVNAAMCDFMGCRFEDIVGRRDHDFVPPEQAELYTSYDRKVLESGKTSENEEPYTDRAGLQRTIVTRKNRFKLRDGTLLLVGCITDITDFRRAERAMRHNAEHDYLTDLANRALFERQLHEALERSDRYGVPLALLLIDLDGFKPVNDALGHAAGDNILMQTANVLVDIVGHPDKVARMGGDEFAIIVHDAWAPETVVELAATIVERLSRPFHYESRQVAISASVGLAFCADAALDRGTLLKQADFALYAAKSGGRSCWRRYDKSEMARNPSRQPCKRAAKPRLADVTG